MAIYKLLRNSAFEPEDVKRLGVAFEMALKELGIKDRQSSSGETLAKLIIEAAQSGPRDSAEICRIAVACLNGPQVADPQK